MAPKRPAEGQSGAEKKRAKMREQRTIPVEGRTGGSAASGNDGLPPTIEVEKFAQARSFEITAMYRAMKMAKAAGTQRAFQSLPRHLRRRAASHNIRRLPVRLRAKALSETPKDAAKPKKRTRKMVGRKRQFMLKGNRNEQLLKRQKNKIWLETHIWHAKRMHMTNIWGHRLADRPTEKAFRASYRASVNGALLHDASYYQYIEIGGRGLAIGLLLKAVCDPAGPDPCSLRYRHGTRECTTDVFNFRLGARRDVELIGPATFIWYCFSSMVTVASLGMLLVRVHPSICAAVLAALQNANAALFESGVPLGEEGLYIRALEKAYLTFEVTGKRATEVIKSVLQPASLCSAPSREAFKKLNSVAGPSSVPAGMIFGLEVNDPRLSFPPRLNHSNPRVDPSNPLVPSVDIADVPRFWDPTLRDFDSGPVHSKGELDRRRSKLLIPGTRLEPTPTDDTIPILLSQRTLPAISLPSRRSEMHFGSTGPIQNSWDADHDEMSGWTLTIPSKWGMAFWNSLVFSETRVGGLRERSQQMFEAGRPRFPEDYPGTKAFVEYELRRAAEDQTYHDRRPPAKRPSYAKLGTVDPFLANFSGILDEIWRETEDWRLAAQTQTHRREHPSDPPAQPNVWLVSPRTATLVLTLSTSEKPGMFTSFDPRSELAARLLREYHGDTKLYALDGRVSTQLAVDLYGALVRVTVTPCGRGSPEELGLLYHLPDDVWESLVDKLLSEEKEKGTRRVSTTEEAYEQPSATVLPPGCKVIGRITTGNFSLKRGAGYGVGAVSLERMLHMKHRDPKILERLGGAFDLGVRGKDLSVGPSRFENLALMRNRGGEVYRLVTLNVMT